MCVFFLQLFLTTLLLRVIHVDIIALVHLFSFLVIIFIHSIVDGYWVVSVFAIARMLL